MRTRWKNVARTALVFLLGIFIGLTIARFTPFQVHDCPTHHEKKTVISTIDRQLSSASTPASVSTPATSVKNTSAQLRLRNNEVDSKLTRPNFFSQEINVRQPLYVGVVTASGFLNTRATDVNNTWGKLASKIEYFASEDQKKHPLPVVSLPGVDDTYPPQKKVYRMLAYMHDNYIDKFNWFLRADDDSYVRVPELLKFLSKLDPSEMLYIGAPGFGKDADLERIKLYPHERYCMGGPGVIFSRGLLIKLAPYLDDCLKNVVVSWNEDLEVGRCISRKLNVQCTWSYEV